MLGKCVLTWQKAKAAVAPRVAVTVLLQRMLADQAIVISAGDMARGAAEYDWEQVGWQPWKRNTTVSLRGDDAYGLSRI